MRKKSILRMVSVALLISLLLCTSACVGGNNDPSKSNTASGSGTQGSSKSNTEGQGGQSQNGSTPSGDSTNQNASPQNPSGSNSQPQSGGQTGSITTTKSSGSTGNSASKQNQPSQGTTQRQEIKILISPGMNFADIAKRLEANGVCSVKAFYSAAQSYRVQSFSIPSDSRRCFKMEGYLQADTYYFYKNDSPERVLKTILNNFNKKSTTKDDRILIIASLIERETRSYEHMQKVAAVIYNRLEKGNMRLQLSCTYDYAVVIRDFLKAYTNDSNPSRFKDYYNTYNSPMVGKLPAGPICSPGANAIKAAKNPANISALYFYFGTDGNNYYSDTYEEHLEKMKKYPPDKTKTMMTEG